MRALLRLGVVVLAAAGVLVGDSACAQEEDVDPFAVAAQDEANQFLMVRVLVEYIGLPHARITELLQGEHGTSDHALRLHLGKLVEAGEARHYETSLLTVPVGQRASLESIREFIYPAEMDFGGLGSLPIPDSALGGALGTGTFPLPLRPAFGSVFETRNTGVTLEIEPDVRADRSVIDLRIAPEIVDLLGLVTWQEFRDQWGNSDLRMPIFESLRTSQGLELVPGRHALMGLLSPRKREGENEEKVLLFVKATLVEGGPDSGR